MDREGFRSRMKQYKKAREENPGLKYWEWKQKYDSAPQPDGMPGQPQHDAATVSSELAEDRAHRWDNGYTHVNRDPYDSPYDDARYYDYRKPRFELRKGGVHYGNPKLLNVMGKFGRILRGGAVLGEAIQQLFPSEEQKAISKLELDMWHQNQLLLGEEEIPKYGDGTNSVKVVPDIPEYKGLQYAEMIEKLKKDHPFEYNRLQERIARNTKSGEIIRYVDANGNVLVTTNMPSSNDPLFDLVPGTGDISEITGIISDIKNGNYTSLAALPLAALPGNWINVIKKSGLDWRPESWFGKRVGGVFSEEDLYILGSHLEEYLDIERAAKANGTWLELPNGELWQGDARSWVQMMSEAGQQLQIPSKVYKTGVKKWDVGDVIAGSSEKHRWLSDTPGVYNSFANTKGYAYYDPFLPQGATFLLTTKKNPLTFHMDAEGRDFYRIKKTNNGWIGSDAAADYAKLFGADVLKIDNIVEGPHLSIDANGNMINPRTSTDLIILKGTPSKSLLGNNGDFDFNKSNIYFAEGGEVEPNKYSEIPVTGFDATTGKFTYGYNPSAGYISGTDPVAEAYLNWVSGKGIYKTVKGMKAGLNRKQLKRSYDYYHDEMKFPRKIAYDVSRTEPYMVLNIDNMVNKFIELLKWN